MDSNPSHALRLTFAYRDAKISLVGSERIAMITPASADTTDEAGQTGYWFGLLDSDGRLVYRQSLHNPVKVDVEVFSSGPGRPITRAPRAKREGQFTVLIPDVASAKAFALHGPFDPDRPDAPARELLRLDVDALRKGIAPPGPGGAPPQRGTGR